ncbi:hypothetical protein IQ260_06065 [Leptolyngbya cf. ectocarpi LEGE 11479]|uniref:ADYC domain-containing protein n=1 Tax=Leptolyngbya cf. ectocarpi LEGE 11479 TaxID=1828722 RepID=A0A928X362_LEPEC|nr:ADYC domain-containing protein [Leptolyngbya ectocarpi]MBE9066213.1 hypothetical protein [Leptolyngbya cf. ectocarpi LEGE 11479]
MASQTTLIVDGQERPVPPFITGDDGSDLPVRVMEPVLDTSDPQQETYLYTVQYQTKEGHWQTVCNPTASGGKAQAIPLSGEWDATASHIANEAVTFACTGGTLAKCVLLGYRPWQTVQGVDMRDYHQACVRMLRADYCGDGISYTQEGTIINLYDRLNIQTSEEAAGLVFEAAWGPEGAVVINRTRFADSWKQVQQTCPERLSQHQEDVSNPETLFQELPQILLLNDSFINP